MKVFRRVLFLAVASILLSIVFFVFMRKSHYIDTMKVFQSLKRDTIDVLGVGSSHMYCTLCPAELYRHTGLSSFLLSTQRQPIEVSYEYVRQALKCHSCKVVVLELLMFVHLPAKTPVDEGVAHDGLDPIPFSMDKIETVLDMPRKDASENYLIPFVKYHSRWRELKANDFKFDRDIDFMAACRGFPLLTKAMVNKSMKEVHYVDCTPLPLDPYFVDWIERFNDMVRVYGAELMLLTAPSPMNAEQRGKYSFLHQYANKHGIKYLDLNSEFNSLGIDVNRDFFDFGHLNVWGAEKATRRIGRYLLENFKFEIDKSPERANEWKNICERYDYYKAKAIRKVGGSKSTNFVCGCKSVDSAVELPDSKDRKPLLVDVVEHGTLAVSGTLQAPTLTNRNYRAAILLARYYSKDDKEVLAKGLAFSPMFKCGYKYLAAGPASESFAVHLTVPDGAVRAEISISKFFCNENVFLSDFKYGFMAPGPDRWRTQVDETSFDAQAGRFYEISVKGRISPADYTNQLALARCFIGFHGDDGELAVDDSLTTRFAGGNRNKAVESLFADTAVRNGDVLCWRFQVRAPSGAKHLTLEVKPGKCLGGALWGDPVVCACPPTTDRIDGMVEAAAASTNHCKISGSAFAGKFDVGKPVSTQRISNSLARELPGGVPKDAILSQPRLVEKAVREFWGADGQFSRDRSAVCRTSRYFEKAAFTSSAIPRKDDSSLSTCRIR